MTPSRPIAIAGAGSIGCFVGGVLAAAGCEVALLGRSRVIDEIAAHGLRVTGDRLDRTIPAGQFAMSDDPAVLQRAGIVLVTVKSSDTAAMAGLMAPHLPADAVVVSLQNGVGNVGKLRRLLQQRVLGGMVPFNVVGIGPGHYHRATSGDVVIERDAGGTAERLSVADLTVRVSDDIAGVQWGKLLVNLNNALNALSGRTLREQLADRSWRTLFADQMAEGLTVVKAAGITPAAATAVPATLLPHLLRLPDFLFSRVLGRAMTIDPAARSSMWDDLKRGRRTEVDYLQGVIVRMAADRGMMAPISQRVVALVKSAEQAGQGAPELTAEQVRGQRLNF